jgi:hypothetical protein
MTISGSTSALEQEFGIQATGDARLLCALALRGAEDAGSHVTRQNLNHSAANRDGTRTSQRRVQGRASHSQGRALTAVGPDSRRALGAAAGGAGASRTGFVMNPVRS